MTLDNQLFVQYINILEAKIDAEIGANGNIRAKGNVEELKYISKVSKFYLLQALSTCTFVSAEEIYKREEEKESRLWKKI